MKRFLPVLMGFALLLLSSTEGWSLPPCEERYHNCFGTYTYPNGSRYVGEYKNDERNGQGTETFADGRIKEGMWKDDKFLYAQKVTPTVKKSTPEKSQTLATEPLTLTEIQRILKYEGFYNKKIDGISGTNTENAIKKWQTKYSFSETGYLSNQQKLLMIYNVKGKFNYKLASSSETSKETTKNEKYNNSLKQIESTSDNQDEPGWGPGLIIIIILSFVFLLIKKNQKKYYTDAPFDDPEIQEEETVTEKEIVKFKTEYIRLDRYTVRVRLKKLIEKIDKDQNGKIDFFETGDTDLFQELIQENQNEIVELQRKDGKQYLLEFQQLVNYLNELRDNIDLEYNSKILNTFKKVNKLMKPHEIITREGFRCVRVDSDKEKEKALSTRTSIGNLNITGRDIKKYEVSLELSLQLYEKILVNCIYLVSSILEDNFLKFYEIYINFEKVGVFNTTWQKEMSNELKAQTAELETQTAELEVQTAEIKIQTIQLKNQTKEMELQTDKFNQIIYQGHQITNNLTNLSDINQHGFNVMNHQLKKINREVEIGNFKRAHNIINAKRVE